jgi:formate dehydrogenase
VVVEVKSEADGIGLTDEQSAGTTVSTFCRICESRCGIEVTVKEGRVSRIGPDKQNPYTWRDFCSKGRSAGEVVDHPRRLRWPLRRTEDGYRRATWEKATEDIASRLAGIRDRHGPDAIALYLGNPVGFNGANGAWFSALARGLKTKNLYSVSSVDQNNLQRVCHEMYGRWLVPLVPDVDECDYFLLVGMNPAVSTFGWIHNVPDGWRRTLARQAQGATVVLVDPNRTESTAKADRHVAVWPGQDWALLLGVLATVLREGLARPAARPALTGMATLEALVSEVDIDDLAARCGVPVADIEQIAREFATARTAMCVAHTGVSHNGEGVLAEWLCHVLNAVTGRLDAVGGRRVEPGYVPMSSMFGTRPAQLSRVRGLPALAGARSLAELADEILTPGDGQVRALICNSGNPVVSAAHGARLAEALGTLDLTVAVDLVQRESHRHADWLLPAAHFLEREDLLPVYSSFEDQPFIQFAQAAVTPPQEVREEWMFWRDLAMALDIPLFGSSTASMTPRALWKQIVDGGGRLTWEELIASPHGLIYAEKSSGHLEEVIATADGAVHLAPDDFMTALRQALGRPVTNASGSWPMLLSNQRLKASMNSWLNDTPTSLRRNKTNAVRIHPDDAERLGIRTGDMVRITSPADSLDCRAEASNDPQIGVAILAHGWGSRVFDPHSGAAAERHGVNRNALVSDTDIDPLSATPAFGTAAVRITRLEPEDGTDAP